jgi:S1-C subfamily serine protease
MKLTHKEIIAIFAILITLLAATLAVLLYFVFVNTQTLPPLPEVVSYTNPSPTPFEDISLSNPSPIVYTPTILAAPTTTVEQIPQETSITPNPVPFQVVVLITMLYDEKGTLQPVWSGSGTIISHDGLILTNAHVALPDTNKYNTYLQIALTKEQDKSPIPMYYAEVMQADQELDIAVLRIRTDLKQNPVEPALLDLPFVILGDSDNLQLGDALTILGYPGIGGDTITLTRGDVSGFTNDQKYGNRAFIKTSATIAGGNSGGLAIDSSGQLVAIPTQMGSGSKSVGGQLVDCRPVADTNGDGMIDNRDTCVPIGGFINALRPINLAKPLIDAAENGEIAVVLQPTPTPGANPSEGILLLDDFSDPSYTNSIWTSTPNSWLIVQGVLKCYHNGSFVAGDVSWKDYAFVVDIMGTEVVDKIISFRQRDSSSNYAIDFRSNPYDDVVLVKNSPGISGQILQSVHVPNYNNTWYRLGVLAVGNRIIIFVDDNIVIDYTDLSSPILNGNVGLGAMLHASANSAVYFDNIVVLAPQQ